jgi:hypothetical protein
MATTSPTEAPQTSSGRTPRTDPLHVRSDTLGADVQRSASLTSLPPAHHASPNGEPLYTAEEVRAIAHPAQPEVSAERDLLYKVRDYAEEREDHVLHNMVTQVLYRSSTPKQAANSAADARQNAVDWAQIHYRNDESFEGRELDIAIAAWTAALATVPTTTTREAAPGQPHYLISASTVGRIRQITTHLRKRGKPATASMLEDLLPGDDATPVKLESIATASVRSQEFEDLLFRFAREAIPVSEVAEVVERWHTQAMLASRSITEQRYALVRQPENSFRLVTEHCWTTPEEFDRSVDKLGEQR